MDRCIRRENLALFRERLAEVITEEQRCSGRGKGTHTAVAEYCELNGVSTEAVLRSIDEGLLRAVKVGHRRLVIAGQQGKSSSLCKDEHAS